jgi:hypothetical protein
MKEIRPHDMVVAWSTARMECSTVADQPQMTPLASDYREELIRMVQDIPASQLEMIAWFRILEQMRRELVNAHGVTYGQVMRRWGKR